MNEEILKALAQVNFELDNDEKEYRLYYDKNGDPLFYTPNDEPGDNYIVVDKETWTLGRYDVKVINDKIVYPNKYSYQKLTPSNEGKVCDTNDVSIVATQGQSWNLTRYE